MNGYLQREQSYGPLASALDNLRYLDHMLRGTSVYPTFAGYMKNLMTPLYQDSRWTNVWDDNAPGTTPEISNDKERLHDSVMFNNLVLETACFYEVPACLNEARKRFSEWETWGKAFEPE